MLSLKKIDPKILAAAVVGILVVGGLAAFLLMPSQPEIQSIQYGIPIGGLSPDLMTNDVIGATNTGVKDLGQPKWADFGLEVEYVYTKGSGQLMEFSAAGQLKIGSVAGFPLSVAISKGAPLKAIAATFPEDPTMRLIAGADSGIRSATDLKNGAKVGITSAGGLSDQMIRLVAKQNNLVVGKDIQLLPLGFGVHDSLVSGDVDAVMGWDPAALLLIEKGVAVSILTGNEITPRHIFAGLYAHDDLIASDPDLVQRVYDAYFATHDWMVNNRAKAVEAVSEVRDLDPAIVDQMFDRVLALHSNTGTIDKELVATTSDLLLNGGLIDSPLDYSDLADTQFSN